MKISATTIDNIVSIDGEARECDLSVYAEEWDTLTIDSERDLSYAVKGGNGKAGPVTQQLSDSLRSVWELAADAENPPVSPTTEELVTLVWAERKRRMEDPQYGIDAVGVVKIDTLVEAGTAGPKALAIAQWIHDLYTEAWAKETALLDGQSVDIYDWTTAEHKPHTVTEALAEAAEG